MARQCIFGSSLRFIINCLLVNILSCTIVLIQSYHISIDNNQLSINSSEENKQLLPTINNYTTANNNETIIKETPEWWIEERSEFYKITRFDLSEENIRILGGKFAQNKTGHLPFWFNFHLFKTVFNKKYRDYDEELLAHTRYVNNCTRILRQRVLRAILAGTVMPKIDEHGDLVSVGSYQLMKDQTKKLFSLIIHKNKLTKQAFLSKIKG